MLSFEAEGVEHVSTVGTVGRTDADEVAAAVSVYEVAASVHSLMSWYFYSDHAALWFKSSSEVI